MMCDCCIEVVVKLLNYGSVSILDRGIRVNFPPPGLSYEIDSSKPLLQQGQFNYYQGYAIHTTQNFTSVPLLTPLPMCQLPNEPPLYLFRPPVSTYPPHPSQEAVYELFQNFNPVWSAAIETEFRQHGFIGLADFVYEERRKPGRTVYPPVGSVFNWSQTSPQNTRVVIMGQEPYFKPNQANGLSFSVPRSVLVPGFVPGPVPVPVPESLKMIYKELGTNNVGFVDPGHGDLSSWAQQGVLLLNDVLTITGPMTDQYGHVFGPQSHEGKGWDKLINAVISWLVAKNYGAVFMLWGQKAQKWNEYIYNHYILYASIPSNRSAYLGFTGCNHFSLCNQLLKYQGLNGIDWRIPILYPSL